MFALWYLSIAFDELRKRFGWRSFSEIFSSNATPKSITNTDNTKAETKPSTSEEVKPAPQKPFVKPVEIPKPEPPKFDPPKPKTPVVEKKPDLPKPIVEIKSDPKPVPKSPETPKLPELPKTLPSPKLPEIPKLPDLPISKPFNNAPEKSLFEKHSPKPSNEDSFTFLENEKDIIPKAKPESPKIEEKRPEPVSKPVEQPKFTPKPFEESTTPKTPDSPKSFAPNLPKFPTISAPKPPPVIKNDFKSAEDRENSIIFNKPAANSGDSFMGDSFTFIDDSPPSRPSAKDATNSFLSGELTGSTGTNQPKKYENSNSSAL